MKTFLLLVTGLLLALLGLSPVHATTWTSPPSGAFKVIEYNIGSGAECSGPTEDCLALLKDRVATYAPHVVLGTEFCYSDYLEFADWLHGRAATATWDVEFAPRTVHKGPASGASQPGDPDPHGLGCQQDANGVYEAKGQVLAGELGTIYRYDLMTPYVDPDNPNAGPTTYYTLLCGILSAGTSAPTRACVTHLEAGADREADRKHELRVIQNLKDGTARDSAGNLVGSAWSRPLIGGDFNANSADAYWVNYLEDDLWYWTTTSDPNYSTTSGAGPGTYAMMDPQTTNVVDHATYRVRPGMSTSARSIQTPDGLSTHNLQESWVRY